MSDSVVSTTQANTTGSKFLHLKTIEKAETLFNPTPQAEKVEANETINSVMKFLKVMKQQLITQLTLQSQSNTNPNKVTEETHLLVQPLWDKGILKVKVV